MKLWLRAVELTNAVLVTVVFFVRWDEIRPKCGLFGDKESKSDTFDHFRHTPYKLTAHIE